MADEHVSHEFDLFNFMSLRPPRLVADSTSRVNYVSDYELVRDGMTTSRHDTNLVSADSPSWIARLIFQHVLGGANASGDLAALKAALPQNMPQAAVPADTSVDRARPAGVVDISETIKGPFVTEAGQYYVVRERIVDLDGFEDGRIVVAARNEIERSLSDFDKGRLPKRLIDILGTDSIQSFVYYPKGY